MTGYLILLVGLGFASIGLIIGIFAADESQSDWPIICLLFGTYMLNGSWVGGLAMVALFYIIPAPVAAISALIVAFFAGRYISSR